MAKFGMFDTEEERDEFIAWRDRTQAEEADRLKGIGITDADNLNRKYAQLCNLWETGEIQRDDEIGFTSDEAREFADKVFTIMHGGPWRNPAEEKRRQQIAALYAKRNEELRQGLGK